MTKQQYWWLLQSEEWKEKREKILKRDKHRCQKCLSRDNLHVHHIWYIDGKKPWEVPDTYLITLCEICHDKEHANRPISSFVKNPKIKKKPNTSNPIKGTKSKNKKKVVKRK